jgi:voltage-gated potassium channel
VTLPDEYLGLSVDQLSERMRSDHSATLLAVSRHGSAYINPEPDFRLQAGDDAVVVAESLGTLAPLQLLPPVQAGVDPERDISTVAGT